MPNLDDRKRRVLAAIVRDYVETAEPVGSKRLVERHGLAVSSATVRNDMARLEEIGLIHQPHTSAGRIPSDTGYRFFVDELMEIPRLSQRAEALLREHRKTHGAEIDEILRAVCAILSKITNYTSVALVPGLHEAELRHIQVSKVDGNRAVVILVTDAGHVIHEFIDAGESHTAAEIDVISSILRRRLSGMRIQDIQAIDVQHLRAESRIRGLLLEETLRVIGEHLDRRTYQVYIDGTMHIVRQPEFVDVERLTRVLEALHTEQQLAALLMSGLAQGGVQVRIGHETKVDDMSDLSLVTASYATGHTRGTVGVVAPTRMDYERAYAAVALAASILEKALQSDR